MSTTSKDCCDSKKGHSHKKKVDKFFWLTLFIILATYLVFLFFSIYEFELNNYLEIFSKSVFSLMNKMAWGLLLGIIFAGILSKLPRTFLTGVLGRGGTFSGIFRATAAGVMLDLCSHGVLLVGMQLYKKGASLGQTMAFLIASPWNSLSLTFVLWALIGFKWTLVFILVSMLIGILSGLLFDKLQTHLNFQKVFLLKTKPGAC